MDFNYFFSIIIIGFIIVALMATNPSTEEHKEAVKQKVSSAFENNTSDGNAFQKLGAQLGQTIGMVIIDKMIKVKLKCYYCNCFQISFKFNRPKN